MTRATSMKRRCSASPQRASQSPDLPASPSLPTSPDLPARQPDTTWGLPPSKRRALLRHRPAVAKEQVGSSSEISHPKLKNSPSEVRVDCIKHEKPVAVDVTSSQSDGNDGDQHGNVPEPTRINSEVVRAPDLVVDNVNTQEETAERVESPPPLKILSCHSLAPRTGNSPCPSPSYLAPSPCPSLTPSHSPSATSSSCQSTSSSVKSSCPSTPSSSRPGTPATPGLVSRVVSSSRVIFSGTVISAPTSSGSFFDLVASAAAQAAASRRAQPAGSGAPRTGPGVGQCLLCRRPLSDKCACKHRDLLRQPNTSATTTTTTVSQDRPKVPPTVSNANNSVQNTATFQEKHSSCSAQCVQQRHLQGTCPHLAPTASSSSSFSCKPGNVAGEPAGNTAIGANKPPEVFPHLQKAHIPVAKETKKMPLLSNASPIPRGQSNNTKSHDTPCTSRGVSAISQSPPAMSSPHSNAPSTSGGNPTTSQRAAPSAGSQKPIPIQVPNPMSFGAWFQNLEKFMLQAANIQQHGGAPGGKVLGRQGPRTPPRTPSMGATNNVKHNATGPQIRPMTAAQAAQAAAQGKTVRDLLDKQRSDSSSSKVLIQGGRIISSVGQLVQRGGTLMARSPGGGTAIRSAHPGGKSVIDLTDDDDRRAAPQTPGRAGRDPPAPGGAVRGAAPPGGRQGAVLVQQLANNNGPVIVQQVMTSQSVRAPPGTAYVYTTRPGTLSMQTAPGTSLVRATPMTSAAPPALRPASQSVSVTRMASPATLTRPPPPLRSAPSNANSAQAKHPAPLPVQPEKQSVQAKGPPPKPGLKISRVQSGIVLSWNMTVSDTSAAISSYQLFAYQETSAPPATSLWKKVGDVKALPLPMACTLTQFQEGNKYHFAVRAVDAHSRVGPFSEPSSIALTVINVS